MSHLFQRPLCDMGVAFDYAYRPLVGSSDEGTGGPCDDRPHRVDLYSADADSRKADAAWRSFALCPEHETQLAEYDARLSARGLASRFRPPSPGSPAGKKGE